MFVKLEGKRCLVVGAGKVGEPKIGGLIETGARIHVVALEASEAVHQWARAGKITLEVRAFATDRSRRNFSRDRGHRIARSEWFDLLRSAAAWNFVQRRRRSRVLRLLLSRGRAPWRSADCNLDERAKPFSGTKASATTGEAVWSRDMPDGWRTWARRENWCWPVISIRNERVNYCTRWQAARL